MFCALNIVGRPFCYADEDKSNVCEESMTGMSMAKLLGRFWNGGFCEIWMYWLPSIAEVKGVGPKLQGIYGQEIKIRSEAGEKVIIADEKYWSVRFLPQTKKL